VVSVPADEIQPRRAHAAISGEKERKIRAPTITADVSMTTRKYCATGRIQFPLSAVVRV